MNYVLIRNAVSKHDLRFAQNDVKTYFLINYYSLFSIVACFHFADIFGARLRSFILLASVVLPAIILTIFLRRHCTTVESEMSSQNVIYTTLPILIVIFSALSTLEIIRTILSMY